MSSSGDLGEKAYATANSIAGMSFGLIPDSELAKLVKVNFEAMKIYFPNLKLVQNFEKRSAILAGLMLSFLDIYRLRKYLFLSKRKITNELNHLLSTHGFPAKYPESVKCYDGPENLYHIPAESIRYIWANVPKLEEGCPFFFVCGDDVFNQLLSIKPLASLFSTLVTIFNNPSVVNSDGLAVQHLRTTAESKYSIWAQSTPYTFSEGTKIYLNYTIYPSVRPDPKSKKALLEAGEFSGKIQPGVYIASLTDHSAKDDRISSLLLSTFYRLAVIKGLPGKNTTAFVPTTNFHYFIGPKDQSKYFVKKRLGEEHINTAGMYRLGRQVELPIEVVEKIQHEFTAETYTKNMLGTRATQVFLDQFDGHGLLRILESIPNFTYKFSVDQRKLISTQHNSVVVGRSGTGKTTCAVMRMIGIRLLEVANKNLQRGVHKIRYSDLCERRSRLTQKATPRWSSSPPVRCWRATCRGCTTASSTT